MLRLWAEEEAQIALPTPFVRLTMLGAGDSGKTSLINAWVNNTCPSSYTPTDGATFYYRTLRVQCPHQTEAEEEKLATALVEIEDTYCWNKGPEEKDTYGRAFDAAECFLKLDKQDTQPDDNALPLRLGTVSRRQPCPQTCQRMGFVIVFDATSAKSLSAAKEIHTMAMQEPQRNINTCYHLLVANKVDKDPWGPATRQNIRDAKDYCRQANLQFVEASAIEFTRVRKLFRDAVEEILSRPNLWMGEAAMDMDAGMTRAKSAKSGQNKEDCTLQ